MDQNDIRDLFAIVQAVDSRHDSDADIIVWHQLLNHLAKDDCIDAVMAHRREQPGVWLEPGHIMQRVRAAMRDRYERADPDVRDQYTPLPPGVHRDRYGHFDKAAPDTEYPAEWTQEQRMQATWDQISRHRNTLTSNAGWDDKEAPGEPADAAVRQMAMAEIRRILNKNTTGMDDDDVQVDVNPVSVPCPFCRSAISEPCTVAGMPGQSREPLRRSRAHPSRLEAAAIAMGMTKQAAAAMVNTEQVAAIRRYRVDHPAGPPPPIPVGSQRVTDSEEVADAPA